MLGYPRCLWVRLPSDLLGAGGVKKAGREARPTMFREKGAGFRARGGPRGFEVRADELHHRVLVLDEFEEPPPEGESRGTRPHCGIPPFHTRRAGPRGWRAPAGPPGGAWRGRWWKPSEWRLQPRSSEGPEWD